MILLLAGLCSCHNPGGSVHSGTPGTVVQNVSIDTQEVLSRCAAVYAEGRSFHIIGVLRDTRPGRSRAAPLLWDFQRPDRSKLQIDMDVAIVLGDNCWIYTTQRGQYTRLRRFTKTLIQTSSFLLSDGVAMLLPELWAGNATIFDNSRNSPTSAWTLDGVDWLSRRPCYQLSRRESEGDRTRNLLVWIDQDSFVIRKWAIVSIGSDGSERPIVACEFQEIQVNAPLSESAFWLDTPESIKASSRSTSRPRG
jgi:outer membrane lipoprotein-sorting protein